MIKGKKFLHDYTVLSIKGSAGEFKGAIQEYKVGNEIIAVGFSTDKAFIMKDSQGLFETVDIQHNLKANGVDTVDCKDSFVIATLEGANEPIFTDLGLDKDDLADIIARLEDLVKLDEQQPFNG